MELDKTFFHKLAQRVLAEMPPEDRFTAEDATLVLAHREKLLPFGEELVALFYDTLYAHPETAKVFREGERPEREETLRRWWVRTLEGPFDEGYWAWQAYVGLAHIRRGVTNAMMLGHVGLVSRFLAEKAEALGEPRLKEALMRLMATVGALVSQGYNEVYLEAAREMTGQSRELMERSVKVALEEMKKR